MNKKSISSFPNSILGCCFSVKGFTLIELLVVVLIIGILAAVALSQYQVTVDKAQAMEILTVSRSLAKSLEMYYLANGEYPKYWQDLDIEIPGCTPHDIPHELGYLRCKNFTADLNAGDFSIWRGNKVGENRSPLGRMRYQFGNGKVSSHILCDGSSSGATDRAKRLCKSLCGSAYCAL